MAIGQRGQIFSTRLFIFKIIFAPQFGLRDVLKNLMILFFFFFDFYFFFLKGEIADTSRKASNEAFNEEPENGSRTPKNLKHWNTMTFLNSLLSKRSKKV